jgi:hypothetical protein
MTNDVKRQIGILIEAAGDPQMRAMLLVLLNMADILAETSNVNSKLLDQVEGMKNQIVTNTVKRNMAIRFLDKTLPYMIAAMWASVAWTWSGITELQKFQIKVESQQHMDGKNEAK